MVMQSRKYILLLALVMLCLGGVIYLFFRDEVIFTSWLFDSFSINPPKFHNAINTDTVFGYIFLYSLADALWYGSLLLVESQLRSNTWYSKAVTVATMALPFAFEKDHFLISIFWYYYIITAVPFYAPLLFISSILSYFILLVNILYYFMIW